MSERIVALIILILILLSIFLFYMAKRDLDCKDFKTQAEAQKILMKDKKDPYHLDGDRNGVACQNL